MSKKEGTATAFIAVVDCAGDPVKGAVVTLNPPAGKLEYLKEGTTAPDSSATATSSDGIAVAYNVPAGNVTVSATLDGKSLRSHDMNSITNAVLLTQVRP